MSKTYTMVVQGNKHVVQLCRAASASDARDEKVPDENAQLLKARSIPTSQPSHQQPEKASPRISVTEFYESGQTLREICLASREGEPFAIPIALAVQLCPLLRNLVDSVMTESATRGQLDSLNKRWLTVDVPCSTDVLRTVVDFITAKSELDLKMSEEGLRMTEQEKKEHWQDFIYYRTSERMDLDDFADEIVKVADYLSLTSLYYLVKCCFRSRVSPPERDLVRSNTFISSQRARLRAQSCRRFREALVHEVFNSSTRSARGR